MRSDSDGIWKVGHALCPMRRVLPPPVMQEQVLPCACAQDSVPGLCLFWHKAHPENVFHSRHDKSSIEQILAVASETSLVV
jgi:hypothetical protein